MYILIQYIDMRSLIEF